MCWRYFIIVLQFTNLTFIMQMLSGDKAARPFIGTLP